MLVFALDRARLGPDFVEVFQTNMAMDQESPKQKPSVMIAIRCSQISVGMPTFKGKSANGDVVFLFLFPHLCSYKLICQCLGFDAVINLDDIDKQGFLHFYIYGV